MGLLGVCGAASAAVAELEASAPAVAPDRPDDASMQEPRRVCCSCRPGWSHDAMFDVLFLQRNAQIGDRPLVSHSDTTQRLTEATEPTATPPSDTIFDRQAPPFSTAVNSGQGQPALQSRLGEPRPRGTRGATPCGPPRVEDVETSEHVLELL
ncbi:MAG: hypothetical protein FJ275_06980 [Planctomycetes bacterium]|nr:hypothetical protein [Planctomycetota bacterium]